MRSIRKSWIGVVLAILFMASLFFFRGSARYSNLFNSDNFVANVSGTQISTTQFIRSLEMNIAQFSQMLGEQVTGDQIRAFQIHQLVLQNLVNKAIFENEFNRIDYIIDDSIIAKRTKNRFPNIYTNNKLNDEALNEFLRQQRLKIEDLVNIIDYETRAQIFDEIFFEKIYPKSFSNKINLYNNQERIIELLKINFQDINIPNYEIESITKDNQELKNFFEDNKMNYMTEEKRDISYIIIDKSTFKNKFIPSQQEISKYFNNNKDVYFIPEKRSFKQFNFKSKKEAEDFKLKIVGLSTDEIITYSNENEVKFNNFENVDRNQVLEDLANVIFSISKNEVSDIVTTTIANHIILLENITPPREPLLDEVSETVKNTLTEVKLENHFNDLILKINQQILDGLSLNQIAEESNLKIQNSNNATIINNDENILSSIVNYAFRQNKDFVSDVIDYNSQISFITNVNEIYSSKIQEFEVVSESVVSDFVKSKKLEYAKKTFEENKQKQSFENIVNLFGVKAEEVEIKLSSNFLPSSFINDIFDSKVNEIKYSSDEENIYFANLKNIKIPNKISNSNDINMLSELKNAFGNEIIKTKNISLNDELINGLLSQYK